MGEFRADEEEMARRRAAIEAALAEGIPRPTIVTTLSQKWGLSRKQVEKQILAVKKKWIEEAADDQRNVSNANRELFRRRAELIFRKAIDSKNPRLSAATQALTLLGKLDGLIDQVPEYSGPRKSDLLERLGPAPLGDPTVMLVWAQKAIALQLEEVFKDPSLPPVQRMRLSRELGAALGMTHAKALFEHQLAEVAQRSGIVDSDPDDGLDMLPAPGPKPDMQ